MLSFERLDQTLLPGFRRILVSAPEGEILALIGGAGPPVLMMHGDPQTHLCWHGVAPSLVDRYTVVLTDLRGRGESHKPGATADSAAYAKRAMAAEQLAVMEALGFQTFRVVGHDRGARVARRMALDHPDRIDQLVVMDVVPEIDLYAQTNADIAQDYFYFFFLTQPFPLPDDLIKASATPFMRQILTGLSESEPPYDEAALALYIASAGRDESITAMCECFRAGLSHDIFHDREDRAAGRQIACPTLVVWGTEGVVGRHFDVPAVWTAWAPGSRFAPLPCGHFIPEEQPEAVVALLSAFLASKR